MVFKPCLENRYDDRKRIMIIALVQPESQRRVSLVHTNSNLKVSKGLIICFHYQSIINEHYEKNINGQKPCLELTTPNIDMFLFFS